jgi:excisionase family DNA binding protein
VAKHKDAPSSVSPLMTVSDLASYLGISRGVIYEMLKLGDIPHIRIFGKDFRFRRDVIDRWIGKKAEKPKKTEEHPSSLVSPLMTAEELADHLRISRQMVYKMVNAGEIPYFRVFTDHGDLRFVREAIAQWIRARPSESLATHQTDSIRKERSTTSTTSRPQRGGGRANQ